MHAHPYLDPEERVCRTCSGHQTDDEHHYMMTCEKYKADRGSLYTSIIRSCQNFTTLTDKDKFYIQCMMAAGAEIQTRVAKFIKDNLP